MVGNYVGNRVTKKFRIAAAVFGLLVASAAFAAPHYGKLIVADSNDADASAASFTTDTAKIYVQAELVEVESGSKVGAAWIAEKTQAAPANYKIDSTELNVGPLMNAATFSLSKPNAGWPVGEYRVDLTINGKAAGNVHFKVE